MDIRERRTSAAHERAHPSPGLHRGGGAPAEATAPQFDDRGTPLHGDARQDDLRAALGGFTRVLEGGIR